MSRGKAQTAERRRRNTDALAGKRRRLSVDEAQLDRDKYEYRWISDADGRLEALTMQDDWEQVTDREGAIKKDSTGEGAEVSIRAGTGATGAPVRQILCRKLKEYQDEDRQAKQRRIDEIEDGMRKSAQTGTDPSDGMSIKAEVQTGA
jgi:hypothetical protein